MAKTVNRNFVRLFTTKNGSSERTKHQDICPIIETCGQCQLLDLPYKAQIIHKNALAGREVKKLGEHFQNVSVKDCIESVEKLQYKHSVELVVSEHTSTKTEGPTPRRWVDIGYYRRDLDRVTDIGRCPVQNKSLNDIVAWTRTGIRVHKVSTVSRTTRNGTLDSIIINFTRATNQALVTFIGTKNNTSELRPLACDLVAQFPNIRGVVFRLKNPPKEAQNSGIQASKVLAGVDTIEDDFFDYTITFCPNDPLPVNPKSFEIICRRIAEICEVTPESRLLHIHSESGLMSFALASFAGKVVAVEESEASVFSARANARKNSLAHLSFLWGEPASVLQTLTEQKEKFDVGIIQTPKNGCSFETYKQLLSLKPKFICVLTSELEQQKKNFEHLVTNHYRPMFVEPVDVLPGTKSLDYITLFCLKSGTQT